MRQKEAPVNIVWNYKFSIINWVHTLPDKKKKKVIQDTGKVKCLNIRQELN